MNRPPLSRHLVLTAAATLLTSALTGLAADPLPASWMTTAERSGFQATSSHEETLELLRRIDQASAEIELSFFGRSGAGRPLPLVVVSADHAFTPAAAAATGSPIVLIQSCIHAGEVDGKDASLMMLRDWATGRRPLPARVTVLFAPIYNPDGHEQVSPYNRPNQDGPAAGMGVRTTAAGIDLNRDHLRLASREAQALIALFNDWRFHLHVDNHVTDGVDHAWVLTWAVAQAPQLSPVLDAWVRGHLPPALAATARAGHPNGRYVELVDELDPAKGHAFGPGTPRFGTDYFPLRNRPSILVEMHSRKPYRQRVEANRDFLLALLDEVGRDPGSLVEAVAAAEQATAAAGRPDVPPPPLVLRWRASQEPSTIRWPAYEWFTEPSVVMGGELLRFRPGRVRELEIPSYDRPQPELTVDRPLGYLVLPGWPQIEALLAGHGLAVWQLAAPLEAEVETLRVAEPVFASRSYQGVVMVDSFTVTRGLERRSIPAGALWVPAGQPDFELAAQLLEPEAPDSMLRWGLVSTVFERRNYIDPDILEDLAREMLADPAVAASWQQALADERFAADRGARYLWWYRRTPFWDEQVGLMPVFRVMTVPEMSLAAWRAGSGPG
jgi:hypothetical protein